MKATILSINNLYNRFKQRPTTWLLALLFAFATQHASAQLVTPAFTANGYPHSGTINVCVNVPTVFSDATMGNVQATYWTFNGGSPNSSSQPTVSVTYNSLGTNTASFSVVDSLGDTATYNFNIVVERLQGYFERLV